MVLSHNLWNYLFTTEGSEKLNQRDAQPGFGGKSCRVWSAPGAHSHHAVPHIQEGPGTVDAT